MIIINKPNAWGRESFNLAAPRARFSQSEGQVIHISCHRGTVLRCDGWGGGVHQGVQAKLNEWVVVMLIMVVILMLLLVMMGMLLMVWMVFLMVMVCKTTWPQGSSGQDEEVTPQLESPSQAPICLSSFCPTWALFHGISPGIRLGTCGQEREVKVHCNLQEACHGYLGLSGATGYLASVGRDPKYELDQMQDVLRDKI